MTEALTHEALKAERDALAVEVTSTDCVTVSELDPIGDFQELKKELASLGMTANEAIEILMPFLRWNRSLVIRRSRLSK